MLLHGICNYSLNKWIVFYGSIYQNVNGHSTHVGLLGCFSILSIKSNEAISIFMHGARFLLSDWLPWDKFPEGRLLVQKIWNTFIADDMHFQMSFQKCDSKFTRPPASCEPVGSYGSRQKLNHIEKQVLLCKNSTPHRFHNSYRPSPIGFHCSYWHISTLFRFSNFLYLES